MFHPAASGEHTSTLCKEATMEWPLNDGPWIDWLGVLTELFKDCDRIPVLQSKTGLMAKAIWEDTVLAESSQCVEVNQYFPPDAIKAEHFKPSATHTVCPWKGTASY